MVTEGKISSGRAEFLESLYGICERRISKQFLDSFFDLRGDFARSIEYMGRKTIEFDSVSDKFSGNSLLSCMDRYLGDFKLLLSSQSHDFLKFTTSVLKIESNGFSIAKGGSSFDLRDDGFALNMPMSALRSEACDKVSISADIRVNDISRINKFILKHISFDEHVDVKLFNSKGEHLLYSSSHSPIVSHTDRSVVHEDGSKSSCEVGGHNRVNPEIEVSKYLSEGDNMIQFDLFFSGTGEVNGIFDVEVSDKDLSLSALKGMACDLLSVSTMSMDQVIESVSEKAGEFLQGFSPSHYPALSDDDISYIADLYVDSVSVYLSENLVCKG